MAKFSGVDIHDFGTTFKAYRREVIQSIPLYGEMHRFIPALASWYGASICEIPIRNVNREAGKSHYGIGPHFPRVFRPDDDSLPTSLHGPPPAFLWRPWNAGDDGRIDYGVHSAWDEGA